MRKLTVALLGGPVLWVVHFLGVYFIVALWCAAGWSGAPVAIGVATLLALGAAAGLALLSLRLWRRGRESLARDGEPGEPGGWDARMGERGARMSFIAVIALFMTVLFALLILLEGTPAFLAPVCPATTVP